MCGRYFLSAAPSPELSRFRQASTDFATGEVTPGAQAAVYLASDEHALSRDTLSWGFPSTRDSRLLINARAETVLERPTFREHFLSRRCLFWLTDFYEWNAAKTRYRFARADHAPLYLAGFYRVAAGHKQGMILTRAADAAMAPIHDRMPVIIAQADARAYLTNTAAAQQLIARPAPELTATVAAQKDPAQLTLFAED